MQKLLESLAGRTILVWGTSFALIGLSMWTGLIDLSDPRWESELWKDQLSNPSFWILIVEILIVWGAIVLWSRLSRAGRKKKNNPKT